MDNPAIYVLGAIDFSGVSGAALSPGALSLEGALSVTLECAFNYGSTASPTGNVKVQTTFDGGQTWRDVARFDLAQATFVKHCNLEFLLSKGVTSYSVLGSEGVYDGVMGNQLRILPTWTGSYAGSTLSVRANVR